MKEKVCVVCGKTFNVYPYRITSSKVCSYKCSGEIRKTKLKRICKSCGKLFYTKPSQFKYYKGAGKYCSVACTRKGIIVEASKREPKKRNGMTTRKVDREWKNAVRERDGYICKKCGKYDRYIHTHHLVMRSQSKILKHELSNGICLCVSCHSWVHHHPKEACALGLLKMGKYPQSE